MSGEPTKEQAMREAARRLSILQQQRRRKREQRTGQLELDLDDDGTIPRQRPAVP